MPVSAAITAPPSAACPARRSSKKFVLKYPGDPSFESAAGCAGRAGLGAGLPCQPHPSRAWPRTSAWTACTRPPPPLRCGARPKPLEDASLLAARPCRPRGSAGGGPGAVKHPLCRPALQNTMCGASAAAQETGVPPPCTIIRRVFRPAARGLLPAACQYAAGRTTGLCHARQRGGQR